MKYEIPEEAIIQSIDSDYTEKITEYVSQSGLHIITDKGDIKLLIDDNSQCCEIFGHGFLETPDSIDSFIGSKLLKIEDVCIEQNREETQLKITTTKGVLQYAVYNEHNGYYSHCTFTQVFDLIEKGSL